VAPHLSYTVAGTSYYLSNRRFPSRLVAKGQPLPYFKVVLVIVNDSLSLYSTKNLIGLLLCSLLAKKLEVCGLS